jgi:hypothetical protein
MSESKTTKPQDCIGRQYVAIHPDLFRCGEAALIVGVVTVNGRECFALSYWDGVEDQTPIENEDFVGKGGEGVFYRIEGANNAAE